MKESSIGLPTIVFVVFLILKLCNIIDWSWWWVTAPIWIPIAVVGVFYLLVMILYFFSKR